MDAIYDEIIDFLTPAGTCFTIQNTGGGTLTVNSITGLPAWLTLDLAPPYNITAGGDQEVCVDVDCTACDGSDLDATLVINSNDADEPAVNFDVHADCTDGPPPRCGPGAEYAVLGALGFMIFLRCTPRRRGR
jgi:hypothetical protein